MESITRVVGHRNHFGSFDIPRQKGNDFTKAIEYIQDNVVNPRFTLQVRKDLDKLEAPVLRRLGDLYAAAMEQDTIKVVIGMPFDKSANMNRPRKYPVPTNKPFEADLKLAVTLLTTTPLEYLFEEVHPEIGALKANPQAPGGYTENAPPSPTQAERERQLQAVIDDQEALIQDQRLQMGAQADAIAELRAMIVEMQQGSAPPPPAPADATLAATVDAKPAAPADTPDVSESEEDEGPGSAPPPPTKSKRKRK